MFAVMWDKENMTRHIPLERAGCSMPGLSLALADGINPCLDNAVKLL